MTYRLSFVALSFLAAGCSDSVVLPGALTDAVGSQQSAVVNGTVDHGHPAAAHCVLTHSEPYRVLSPIQFYLGGVYGIMYPGATVAPHPNYAGGNQSDIAVVRLSRDVVNVNPVPLVATGPNLGEQVTVVGYGVTGDAGSVFGTKRQATSTVKRVAQTVFSFGGSGEGGVCEGDSGGPTFVNRGGQEQLIGVHSTSTMGCQGEAFDIRVDAYASWINAQMTKSVYGSLCQGPGDCLSQLCLDAGTGSYCSEECDSKACPFGDTCTPVNGGAVQNACIPNSGVGPAELGERCQDALDCASQICVPLSNAESVCTEQCSVQQNNCPGGFGCVPVSEQGDMGVCIAGSRKGLGEACQNSIECTSFLCISVPSRGQLCSEQCTVGSGDCGAGYDCVAAVAGGGLCVPAGSVTDPIPQPQPQPQPGVKKPDGAICGTAEECQSNLCANTGNVNTCLARCELANPVCAEGFDCLPVNGTDFGACVHRPRGPLGAPCSESSECQSNICATAGETQFCTELCDPAVGCGEGFDCVPAGEIQHACQPSAPATDPARTTTPPDDDESGSGCSLNRPVLVPWLGLLLIGLLSRRRCAR
jgi:hypothetical protein